MVISFGNFKHDWPSRRLFLRRKKQDALSRNRTAKDKAKGHQAWSESRLAAGPGSPGSPDGPDHPYHPETTRIKKRKRNRTRTRKKFPQTSLPRTPLPTAQHFALFFSSLAPFSLFFFSLGGLVFSLNCGRGRGPAPTPSDPHSRFFGPPTLLATHPSVPTFSGFGPATLLTPTFSGVGPSTPLARPSGAPPF